MKKRNLALAMVLAMAMTTIGSATVFADDASDDAAGNELHNRICTDHNEQPILDRNAWRYQRRDGSKRNGR